MKREVSYFKNGQRHFSSGDGGSTSIVGPEGLLCAIFGVSQKDIHYPPPRLLPMQGEVDDLPMKSVTWEFEEWLTGFWEGDGTAPLYGISVCQKFPQILLEIQEGLEGGTLHSPTSSGRMWYLAFLRSQGETLRKILSRHLVCPKRLEQLKPFYPEVELHRPTRDWFVGFWDAEGFSYSDGKDCLVGLSQKDKFVLGAVRELWTSGKVYGWSWTIRECEDSYQEIVNLLLGSSRNRRKKLKLIADAGLPLPSVI